MFLLLATCTLNFILHIAARVGCKPGYVRRQFPAKILQTLPPPLQDAVKDRRNTRSWSDRWLGSGHYRPVIWQAPKNLMTLGISLSSAPGSLDSVSRAEPGICIFTKPLRRSDDWPSWRTTWVEQGSFKTRLCSQKEPKRNPCSNVYRLSGP